MDENNNPTTYDEVKQLVDDNGGVVSVNAASLREAEGAGRLTERINGLISKSLASRGLGHVPYAGADLPTSQWEKVRIFDKTSALGDVITAAHEVGDEADARLRDAVNGDAARLLEQVRTLLA